MARATSPTHPTHPDVDLVDGAFYGDDPHPLFAWMRRHAPVYYDEANGVWGVTRYHDVKAVSSDRATFSNAGGIRPDSPPLPMMIDMDDPEHRRRRRLVSEGFTPRRVGAREDQVRQVCDDIIDRVCEKGRCDFVADIAAPLPMIMVGDMLGVAPEDRDDLLRWSDDMLRALGSPDPEAMERAMQAFAEYSAYIAGVVTDRRRHGRRDDLVGVLVHAEVDGDRLDDLSLVHETLLILIGGDETTRHVISGGMYELLRHPEQHQGLRQDPRGLTRAIEEMLRWVSPIKNMARTVTVDCELRGQKLRAGQKLVLLYPSANRDGDVFDEPDTFDIDRHPNEHVAFGFGPHFCLGSNLARLELRVMFERLLARLPDMALADDAEPPRRPANFVSGFESMPVVFTPAERAAV
jgi:cytochrome P450 family 142 subfamily A polypeptide 1